MAVQKVEFCEVEDLEALTGLSHQDLWNHYFNLDDCDAVMVVDENDLPLRFEKNEFGYGHWVLDGDLYRLCFEGRISGGLYDILRIWEDYCVGACYTKYNGKVYVSKHHA